MARLTDDELSDIKARNPLADVAGGYVQLRKAGGRLVGPCPICGGRKDSQRFEVKSDGWVCAVCTDGGDVIALVQKVEGCDFTGAIDRLGGRREIDQGRAAALEAERAAKQKKRDADSARYREKERKRLFTTWQRGLAAIDTPVQLYLAGRGLGIPQFLSGIRFIDNLPYFHGDEVDDRGRSGPKQIHAGPAMLAAFIRADGHFGGLHITWLSSGSPPAKAEIQDPETGELLNAKKMRGSKSGAHIAIVKLDAPTRLVIGEGIETTLAVWTAHYHSGRDMTDYAFWAAGDLGNMAGRATETLPHPTAKRPNGQALRVPGPVPDPDDPGLAIPDSVTELLLLGDGDSDLFLTRHAMTRAARRYARDGRTIRIAFAPDGHDFNDVLRGDDR